MIIVFYGLKPVLDHHSVKNQISFPNYSEITLPRKNLGYIWRFDRAFSDAISLFLNTSDCKRLFIGNIDEDGTLCASNSATNAFIGSAVYFIKERHISLTIDNIGEVRGPVSETSGALLPSSLW